MKRSVNREPARAPLLERLRKEISRCVKCGTCRAVCPSFLRDRQESLSARGRMALVEAALEGRIGLTETLRDRLAQCAACLACEQSCPSNVPVSEIIQAAKEQAFAQSGAGLRGGVVSACLSHEGVLSSLSRLAPLALHVRNEAVFPSRRDRAGEKQGPGERTGPRRGRVAFFPGCVIRHFQTDVGRAATTVLSALGYEVVVPEGLACCGAPLLSLGDREAGKAVAVKNSALLASLKADAVVTACATCGLTFKKEYPKLLAPLAIQPVPVLDIHELLIKNISELGFGTMNVRITWHEPCHLGRGQGLSQIAREVLTAVPGLELVEMQDPDRCCGFGGTMRLTHASASEAIGAEKAKAVLRTRASLVVTGCPACRMQIIDALRRAGSTATVVHTVQVLEEALENAEFGVRNAELNKIHR